MNQEELEINVLALGDIVGEAALNYLEENLSKIKKDYNVHFVIANGENVANARGITKKLFYRILNCGVDVVTMGNHTYSNKEIYDINDKRLLVPVNYDENTRKKGYGIYNFGGTKILVCNVLGKRLGASLNGFKIIDDVINNTSDDVKIRIIDFHSEYCNEKRSMAHMLKDKISALYGTHTHVQTSDDKILYNKLGYITDIWMCGPINSAIGYDLDFEVKRYLEELDSDSILSSDNKCSINGVLFKIDVKTGKTKEVKRIIY